MPPAQYLKMKLQSAKIAEDINISNCINIGLCYLKLLSFLNNFFLKLCMQYMQKEDLY